MRSDRPLAALLAAACGSGAPAASPDAGPAPRLRDRLSQTGLYTDIAGKTIAGDLMAFAPAHVLWSDGADKRRWIRLPPGTRVDTSDMDHWIFPVGTQFFKEFSLNGVLLETRLVERIGDTGHDDADYWMGAFVWLPDGSDAIFAPGGATDVNGTRHDVPKQQDCWSCHLGEPGHGLGFSRVQLPQATVDALVADGRLGDPPTDSYAVPGDAVTAAALGYLHANCGHCHNPHGIAWPDTQQVLRLSAGEPIAEDTEIYRTTIGKPLQSFQKPPFQFRIVAGDPEASAVFFRMSQRGSKDQMPSLATELADPHGNDLVRAWIAGLPAN